MPSYSGPSVRTHKVRSNDSNPPRFTIKTLCKKTARIPLRSFHVSLSPVSARLTIEHVMKATHGKHFPVTIPLSKPIREKNELLCWKPA